jgi:hypothetical protein
MYNLPCPEPMSEWQIQQKAHELFMEYVREVGDEHVARVGIDFDEAYDALIYPKHEIMLVKNEYLGCDDDGCPILGEFIPRDRVALIDKTLFDEGDPRRVFTTVHEVVGHGVLQGDWLRRKAGKYPKLHSTQESMSLIGNTFEWQANTMATNFIAPLPFVQYLYEKVCQTKRKVRYAGPGRYCLYMFGKDMYVNVGSAEELAWVMAKRMKHYFWGLSAESLAYRLREVAIEWSEWGNRGFRGSKGPVAIGQVLGEVLGR